MLNLTIAADAIESLWLASKRTGKGFNLSKAIKGAIPLTAGMVAFAAGTASRGKMLETAGNEMSSQVGGLAGFEVGSVLGQAVIPIPVLGGIVGGLVGGYIGSKASPRVGTGIAKLVESVNSTRTLNFGGNYKDTTVAYTMRQRAAQELGSSLLNARQYLGKEAVLMYQ